MEIVKVCRSVTIKHPKGLHIRPVTEIVKFLSSCEASVYFIHQGLRVNAKSILSVLSLAAGYRSLIEIDAEGDDAEEIIERFLHRFEDILIEAPVHG